ncbi:hypothetical protein D3C87_1057810 [compost metagenome]
MVGPADPVEGRVTHVEVGRRHVDLGAQDMGAVLELAGAHALEEVEVLLDRAIAVRAVAARLGRGAAVLAHLLGREALDVGEALVDELDRVLVELLVVVRGVEEVFAPVEAQPFHVGHDGVDVFEFFLGGVGVVEPQVAAAAVLLGNAEVQADRLGMADVQVTVRLRRKAGDDGLVLAGAQVILDDLTDEIEVGLFGSCRHVCGCSIHGLEPLEGRWVECDETPQSSTITPPRLAVTRLALAVEVLPAKGSDDFLQAIGDLGNREADV